MRPARRLDSARGAATIEFAVVAVVALIPLVLGILQLGLLYATKQTLQHAAFLAARAGAVAGGSRETMLRSLAKGLAPLHAGRLDESDPASAAALAAFGRAYADVRRPDRVRLATLNPSAASFRDFALERDGDRVIPNRFTTDVVGVSSRQTLADANVLKIRVDYCAALVVPVVDRLLTGVLGRGDTDAFRLVCYAERRMPLVAHAVVQMHSAPRLRAMEAG